MIVELAKLGVEIGKLILNTDIEDVEIALHDFTNALAKRDSVKSNAESAAILLIAAGNFFLGESKESECGSQEWYEAEAKALKLLGVVPHRHLSPVPWCGTCEEASQDR